MKPKPSSDNPTPLVGSEPEPHRDSDIDWAEQNRLNKEWLKNNPDATYGGWMSI